MIRDKFYRLLEDSRFLMVISVVIAILLWGYVVIFVNNEILFVKNRFATFFMAIIYNLPLEKQSVLKRLKTAFIPY